MIHKLNRLLQEENAGGGKFYPYNFFYAKKPMGTDKAKKKAFDKNIEGHIIICGVISGIKHLILPLRSKALGSQRRPIIILSNDGINQDSEEGTNMQFWDEINRFEDIFMINGSAMNPADLEKAKVKKAKAIIIPSKSYEGQGGSSGQNMLDADAIFMYKTIEANYSGVTIVTELASMRAIAFLVQGNEEKYEKRGYYMSRPFAQGEIYVSSLLDSLMC